MTKEKRKEYMKEYYEANKEKCKAWYQAHKEKKKAYYKVNKEKRKEYMKEYYEVNKEKRKEYMKEYYEAHKEQKKEYQKSDVNSLGKTKQSIRNKSNAILHKTGIKIPGYEIHHCFGYEDASKFIYCSKELHLKIHKYLRDNNIDAATNHWMQIRDIVNDTDEFTYIKC